MSKRHETDRPYRLTSLLVALALAGPGPALAVEQSAPVTPVVFDGDLRDLAPVRAWRPGDPIKEVPRRYYPREGSVVTLPPPPGSVPDQLIDLQRATVMRSADQRVPALLNFAGIGFTGVSPPDTVGDVGPGHYIQSVNDGGGAAVRVFNKSGAPVTAEFQLDSLWTGGGACASGFGDPIVLHDGLADRWLMSEFAGGGNNLCVYISRTSDPVVGGWFGYQFTTPNFPDYPKYAVWPTAYVVTSNEGNNPPVYGLDRSQMLLGTPATSQRFTVTGLSGFGFEALTPADHDGVTAPPAAAPAYVLRHRDDESHGGGSGSDFIDIWALALDWVTPASSTLTQLASISVTEFDSALCGLSTLNCIPQPATAQTLDPLREVLMWRVQYRNLGTHEVLVGNLAVDIGDFPDHAGIRWFELRKSGAGPWTRFQEGTFSPDATHRWMGSAAMDAAGGIGLAYSLSNTTTIFPSLAFTGRTAGDPVGVMTEAETQFATGVDSQGFNRWGDYASLNVDPADNCTFWFTSEYMSGADWGTRIASFQLPGCLCLAPVTAPASPTATAVLDNQIDLRWNDSVSLNVTTYRLRRATTPGGPYTTIATLPDSSPGTGGGPPYAYSDATVSGGTRYYYIIIADDGGNCSATSIEVNATATGPCLLEPTFAGLDTVTDPSDCSLVLAWAPATSNCATGPITYDIHRDIVAGFTPSAGNRIATGVLGTSYVDSGGLLDGVRYYYVVRAVDGGLAESNLVERSGIAGGPPGATISVASTDTPIAIPDNSAAGVTSSLDVIDVGALRGITIQVEVTHPRIGNIALTLVSPTGTAVQILNRVGRPPRGGCVDDDMDVTFDDSSTFDLDPHCPGTTPWYVGVAAPLNPLAAFLGEPINGTWQLVASDRDNTMVGNLVSWTLNLTPAEACSANCDVSRISPVRRLFAVKAASDVALTWDPDLEAGDYSLRWVAAKGLIPARLGTGNDVCITTVRPPTPCVDLAAVPPDGLLRHYNVIGACGASEATE